ncbi:hypothetical protein F5148DRAFT_1195215 [Russula earlei]|uniref:Uncharacterized protein n=1 Tax=Russula earlei TaxID=71964 RepID=A0ACC0UBB5_9AGAM|nr:hypothetical protein F5148DRAFT_1195215 [Russula earlei]
MVTSGIGSRSSPIIIDDDDDDGFLPPSNRTDHNSLTKPLPEVMANMVQTRDPTSAMPPEHPNPLTSGIGYSILIRMGYKPGYGLGVNLEGVTSPVKSPVGIGASRPFSSRNQFFRNASPATTGFQSSPAASDHAPESSSLSPADTSAVPRRGWPEYASNQVPHLNSLPVKGSPDRSAIPLGIVPGYTDASKSPHAFGTCKTNTHPNTLPLPVAQPIARTCPPDGPTISGSPNVHLPILVPMPSSTPLALPPPPVNSRTSAPVNPPLAPVEAHSRPLHPLPPIPSPPTPSIPYLPKVKGKSAVLGMHPDDKVKGTRGLFLKDLQPPPTLSRSVVMEILPRKFRTQSFIFDWLSQFTFQPVRHELVEGKAFFEFSTEKDALFAWNSPRMGGQDGLLGVRLFWYRVLPQLVPESTDTTQQDNATGTIESFAQPVQSVSNLPAAELVPEERSEFKADLSQSQISTCNVASPSALVLPSEISVEEFNKALVHSPAKDIRSNPDEQPAHGPSSPNCSGNTSFPPTATTSSLSAPTPLSDPSRNRMATDNAMIGGLPLGGVSGFIPHATVLPILIHPPSPMSSSILASTSPHSSPSTCLTFSPTTLESSVITMLVDPHADPIAPNQELALESHLATETLYAETEVKRTGFEKFDRTLPDSDDPMETTDILAIAKEQALREIVHQSRKRRLLQGPSKQQLTSSTTSTTASLEDLATSFIADAIARPPPSKRVKITPSPSVMAAWGQRLERHVQWSKAIMVKIQSTRSKSERNRLMTILREKDGWMALFSSPVEDAPAPVSPWPDSHPGEGILELSDTDDEDDYDYDEDME